LEIKGGKEKLKGLARGKGVEVEVVIPAKGGKKGIKTKTAGSEEEGDNDETEIRSEDENADAEAEEEAKNVSYVHPRLEV